MSFLTPAWKGDNKDRGLRAVRRIFKDEKLLQVVREAPDPDVKLAAIERVSSDAVLLEVVRLQPSSFLSLGSKEYNLRRIKQRAFECMRDEAAITEAALIRKPEKDDFVDKVHDEDLLYRLASTYYLPAAFDRITDDKKQIELAQRRLSYVDRVRNKRGYDWELLLLDGDYPKDARVENARSSILDGDRGTPVVNNFGIRLLQDYLRYNQKDLPIDTSTKLRELNDRYAGIELWARIGMLGLFPPRDIPTSAVSDYAKQLILEGRNRGATVLMRHFADDLPTEKLEEIERLRMTCSGQELWRQIVLLGVLPAEKMVEYCRELVDGGDWCGLEALVSLVREKPHTREAASAVRAIKEIYHNATAGQTADALRRCRSLPDGMYGRHVDYESTTCGYTDHMDNGVQVHFDMADL